MLLRPLPFLLLIRYPSRLRLSITNLTEIEPDGACPERIGLRRAAVLLKGRPEAADESVQASPGLPEWARAGNRRVRVAEEGAHLGVHLRLPELIEVTEKLQDVGAAAPVERQRRPVVPQVLSESVPVAPLLRLVPARRLHRLRHHYLPAEQA